jgi:flavin-dependent dehydrogenase
MSTSPASDIQVYQKLTAVADELEQMAVDGATLVGEAALVTAATTVRGMANAVYEHIMAQADGRLDS